MHAVGKQAPLAGLVLCLHLTFIYTRVSFPLGNAIYFAKVTKTPPRTYDVAFWLSALASVASSFFFGGS